MKKAPTYENQWSRAGARGVRAEKLAEETRSICKSTTQEHARVRRHYMPNLLRSTANRSSCSSNAVSDTAMNMEIQRAAPDQQEKRSGRGKKSPNLDRSTSGRFRFEGENRGQNTKRSFLRKMGTKRPEPCRQKLSVRTDK